MESQVRQNYHRDCEAAINRMVNMELFASYSYTSMVRVNALQFFLYYYLLVVCKLYCSHLMSR